MRKLSTNGVKALKCLHLIFVVMWVGGVMAMAIITLLKPQSGDELHLALVANRFIDDALVIPGAILTMITAIIYGAFTNWGFFKHTWITVKWIVSVLVIIVGTFYFSPMLNRCLAIAAETGDTALGNQNLVSEMHITTIGSFVQAAILVVLVVISVFKPWKKKKQAK